MQTIRITITCEKPASIVITEQKPESKDAIRKAALATLEAMFEPVLNEGSKYTRSSFCHLPYTDG